MVHLLIALGSLLLIQVSDASGNDSEPKSQIELAELCRVSGVSRERVKTATATIQIAAKPSQQKQQEMKLPSEFKLARWTWAQDGSTQRTTFREFPNGLNNLKVDFCGDCLLGPFEYRLILGVDPEIPLTESTVNETTKMYTIGKRSRTIEGREPYLFFLWVFDPFEEGRRSSLQDLLDDSDHIDYPIDLRTDGQRLVGIRIHFAKQESPARWVELYFDEQHDFACCRVRSYVERDNTSASVAAQIGLLTERTVLNFHTANGIHFPASGEIRYYDKSWDHLGDVITVQIDDIHINDALPQGVMDFRFPVGALVRYEPPENGKRRFSVWGSDNQPVKDLTTEQDWQDYIASVRRKTANAPGSRSWSTMVLVNVVFLAVLGAVWIVHVRRRRSGQ